MRLLMTTDTVGGVWTFTSELSEQLLQRGHAIALLALGGIPTADQSAWAVAQADLFRDRFTFTYAAVPLEWEQENSTAFSAGETALAEVSQAFAPDLLVSNQFCFGASTLPLPRVVVAHSDVLSWARASKPSALEPTPWLNQYTMLVQRGLLQADAIAAPTRSVIDGLGKFFFLHSTGNVIPNGRRVATSDQAPERRLQAITAGRLWDEAKGLALLTKCEFPLPVLVAGETRTASAPPLPPSLQELGWLSPDDLHTTFRESAIYLCTSLYEPFGLAPLEAALCGCAVLARDLPSLREVWGEDALFFRNAAELTAQLRVLIDDPSALAAAQRRSHSRAGQYTPARMAESYLTLFEAVLRNRSMAHVA